MVKRDPSKPPLPVKISMTRPRARQLSTLLKLGLDTHYRMVDACDDEAASEAGWAEYEHILGLLTYLDGNADHTGH